MNYAVRARQLGAGLNSLVSQWTQRGFIKSIQRGTITVSAATSATATINAVVLANSVLLWGGFQNDLLAADYDQLFPRISLTNTTTVTATKTTATSAVVVSFEVIEFYPGVLRSIQRGTISIGPAAAANTATITAVTLAKASLVTLAWTGQAHGGGGEMSQTTAQLVLTNTTTVTATRTGTAGTIVVGYQVMEFY